MKVYRTALGVSVLPALALCLGACTKEPAHLLDPVEAGAENQRRFATAFGRNSGTSVLIEERSLTSSTKGIAIQFTVLFAQVHNEGTSSLRFREEDFVLRLGEEVFAAVPVDKVINGSSVGLQEARIAKTEALRPRTLAPGESADGFLFFRTRIDREELAVDGLEIALTLYDQNHESQIDSIEVPLVAPQRSAPRTREGEVGDADAAGGV